MRMQLYETFLWMQRPGAQETIAEAAPQCPPSAPLTEKRAPDPGPMTDPDAPHATLLQRVYGNSRAAADEASPAPVAASEEAPPPLPPPQEEAPPKQLPPSRTNDTFQELLRRGQRLLAFWEHGSQEDVHCSGVRAPVQDSAAATSALPPLVPVVANEDTKAFARDLRKRGQQTLRDIASHLLMWRINQRVHKHAQGANQETDAHTA